MTVDYLLLDASFFRYHVGAAAEPIVAAWGIDTAGKPVFVGLDTASGESADAWETFLSGLGERGLSCPLMVISDGAAGPIGAVGGGFAAVVRRWCRHSGRGQRGASSRRVAGAGAPGRIRHPPGCAVRPAGLDRRAAVRFPVASSVRR